MLLNNMNRILISIVTIFITFSTYAKECDYSATEIKQLNIQQLTLCAQSNPKHQNYLGTLYATGKRVPKNMKKAFYYFSLAAKNNFPGGMFNLGNMYRRGLGVSQNYNKAFYLFYKSAKLGYVSAQHNLGFMYGNGFGTQKNLTLSYAWFYVGMQQGYAASFHNANALLGKLSKKEFFDGIRLGKKFYLQYAIKSTKPPVSPEMI